MKLKVIVFRCIKKPLRIFNDHNYKGYECTSLVTSAIFPTLNSLLLIVSVISSVLFVIPFYCIIVICWIENKVERPKYWNMGGHVRRIVEFNLLSISQNNILQLIGFLLNRQHLCCAFPRVAEIPTLSAQQIDRVVVPCNQLVSHTNTIHSQSQSIYIFFPFSFLQIEKILYPVDTNTVILSWMVDEALLGPVKNRRRCIHLGANHVEHWHSGKNDRFTRRGN